MPFCGRLARQWRGCLAADHLRAVVLGIAALAKAHLLAQQAQRGVVDARDRHLARFDQLLQVAVKMQLERHFQVLAGERRLLRVAHAEDEVRHNKALKAPLSA